MDPAIQQLIDNYRTPQDIIGRLKDIEALIITGISGAGKDTIIQSLLSDPHYTRVVTSTTRAPRQNNGIMEQEGVDYYYLSLNQANEKLQGGEYIEVQNVHGRVNGSLIKEYERIAESGNSAVTSIDYMGAVDFLTFDMKRLTVVFVVPPNFEVWFARLTERYGGSLEGDHDEVLNRMRSAQKEIAFVRNDSRFVPVMNDDIDRVASEIKAIADGTIQLESDRIEQNYKVMDELLSAINSYLEKHS